MISVPFSTTAVVVVFVFTSVVIGVETVVTISVGGDGLLVVLLIVRLGAKFCLCRMIHGLVELMVVFAEISLQAYRLGLPGGKSVINESTHSFVRS